MQYSSRILKLLLVSAGLYIASTGVANGQTLKQSLETVQREVETNGSRYLVKRNTNWNTGCFTPSKQTNRIRANLKQCADNKTCNSENTSAPILKLQKTRTNKPMSLKPNISDRKR